MPNTFDLGYMGLFFLVSCWPPSSQARTNAQFAFATHRAIVHARNRIHICPIESRLHAPALLGTAASTYGLGHSPSW
ncbi:hypothetical protein BJ166DRAFT_528004 [Pestalotiopsis sp. NC0098]|nr:hypothetical protein BJ166DRAFT_528004 [Pestalotiopsis sp. NC0098]